MKNLAMSIPLLLFATVAASGQTFAGTLIGETPDIYLFDASVAGQYEATVMWEDSDDILFLVFICLDDQGEAQNHGLSTGFRDRTLRLNLGILGPRQCGIGVSLLQGLFANYTLNFQATTAGVDSIALRKVVTEKVSLRIRRALAENAQALQRLRKAQLQRDLKGSPTTTILTQIRSGTPQIIEVAAADDVLELTAMWNRADTDLTVALTCGADDEGLDWGISTSGQERFLRFDTDVIAGTTCTVTLTSSNTMVYALNIAFYGDGEAF